MQDNYENAVNANAPKTDIALLPPAERAVIVLDSGKTEAQLRELVKQSADITEVKDKDGREQAHRAGMNLKNVRVAIEKTGKAARDDANAFNKAVIAEENRLKAIAQAEEDRIFALRDRFDAEQARIKAEAERKEAERKARIQGQISAIRNIPVALAGASAAEIATDIADLETFQAGEEFAEFHADADAAALTALATLRDMHKRQVAAEAEAARVAAERAALEAEKAERERVAAETKRQLEAQQAALAEERRKAEAEMQAQREAIAAERRALEEQKAEAARAETEKQAAANAPSQDSGTTGPVVDLAAITEYAASVQLAIDKIDFTITPVSAHPISDTHPASDQDSGVFQGLPATDLPPDEADEAAEAALRARVECLNMAVSDLLVMGCTAEQIRELVDLAIVATDVKVAA